MIGRRIVESEHPALIDPKVALDLCDKIRPDGSWGDLDYQGQNRSNWQAQQHLVRCKLLAAAWSDPRHADYHDPKLAVTIQSAVNFWTAGNFQSANWWYNEIQVPQLMAYILIAGRDFFSPEERLRGLDVVHQAKIGLTGQNRIWLSWIVFCSGEIEQNQEKMNAAVGEILNEITIGPKEGIRADGCFHQHGPQVQLGNYGLHFINSLSKIGWVVNDSQYAISPQKMDLLRQLCITYGWGIWHGNMDLLIQGRELYRDSQAKKAQSALDSILRFSEIDPQNKSVYLQIIRQNQTKINQLVGCRVFWNSDLLIQRRPDWYASVRMNSRRVRVVEDNVNFDNALGRYFSDGVMLVMQSGEEYCNIVSCWDWTRLPGTTLPATPIYTPEESKQHKARVSGNLPRYTLSKEWRLMGESNFTGSVTDGEIGVSVYTQSVDGVDAKKAYFLGTKSIVGLGCKINSSSPFPVATTVNSCLQKGEVIQNGNWVWHDNIGYRGDHFKVTVAERKGNWQYVSGGYEVPQPDQKKIFSITVEHGIRPQNQSYAYFIVPGVAAEEIDSVKTPEILANNETIQAVKFADGSLALVFYQAGALGDFSTDFPGLFLIKKDEIFVADPSGNLMTGKICWRGKNLKIDFPQGDELGKTVKLSISGTVVP